jgi:hypothetical protein
MSDEVKVKDKKTTEQDRFGISQTSGFFPGIRDAFSTAFSETFGNPYYNPVPGGMAGPPSALTKTPYFAPQTAPAKELTTAQKLAQAAAFQASGRADQNRSYANRDARQAAIDEANRRAAEFDARYSSGGGGGGAARPDFSGYRNALMGQADELNARIQAMYNQLGEQAGANVGRIQDIYGGAQTGVGDIYDSATGNIQQAFSSAQQQAADQLARLGIEAAAPAVTDPMALSQAQAMSGLEGGRASGLSALERYGATASDFGSQMAQTAQQQGTEMNAAILASLQNRLAESLAAEQAGGGGGGGGRSMSVSDMLKLDEARQRYITGEPSLDERKFQFEQARAAADPVNRFLLESQSRIMESLFPRGGGKAVADPETLVQSEAALYQQLRQALGQG